jgi:hypothetical protein
MMNIHTKNIGLLSIPDVLRKPITSGTTLSRDNIFMRKEVGKQSMLYIDWFCPPNSIPGVGVWV